MDHWVGRAVVPVGISVVFVLLRRFMPAPKPASEGWSYATRQGPEPLPTGVIGATMWGIGICLLGSIFLFREANHLWANLDGPATLRVYETKITWCFFPGFAALCIPWPLTVWMLRRMGRNDEADALVDESSRQTGFDSYRVMAWFSYWVALPIGVFTLMAIPIHLSIGNSEVRAGRYGRWTSESFPYDRAVRARLVSVNEMHAGRSVTTRNLLIDFSDGRTLDASIGQDGGEAASPEVVSLLLEKTGLQPASQ